MDQQQDLTIEELARRGGVPVRTVRFYIAEGLLPGPEGRGKATSYGEEHLLRLRLVRLLSEQRVPLAEQRARLAGLSLSDLRELLAAEEPRAAQLWRVHEAPTAREYVQGLLDRARMTRQARPDQTHPPPLSAGPMEPPRARQPMPLQPAPRVAESWRRWELAPGLELHVRADVEKRFRRLIQRWLREAREQAERGET